jgi:hypothetical protein
MVDIPRPSAGEVAAKRTECVKVCMEPDMFLDFAHDAMHADRTVGEYIYLLLRDWKYGHGTQEHRDRTRSRRVSDAP